MTNAEINLNIAVQALKDGKLKGAATSFIEDIKDYDKRDLKRLTKNQYKFLNDTYRDHEASYEIVE